LGKLRLPDGDRSPDVAGSRCGKPTDHRKHVRPRSDPRDEEFDLPLAPTSRLCEKAAVILGGQARSQESHRAQVQRASRQEVQDDRESPARAGRLDAVERGVLGEAQGVRAVAEQGTVPLAEVELPRVELGQVRDQLGCDFALPPSEHRDSTQEFLVGKCRHHEIVHGHAAHPLADDHRSAMGRQRSAA
jgi:hypothetical protein